MFERPRPVLFKAKASIFEAKSKASDHDCWRKIKKYISHQNPILKLTTKRSSKHKLFTKLSLSLHFSHQQATVTGGYYIWETQAGWGVFRARFGCTIRPLWLNTRSTGADVAGTDKTYSSSACSIWIVASAFSCNHGSSIGTGDDTCPSASSRYAV